MIWNIFKDNNKELKIMVNGIVDEESFVFWRDKGIYFRVYNKEIIDFIKQEKIQKLLLEDGEIKFPLPEYYDEKVFRSDIDYSNLSICYEGNKYIMKLELQYNYEDWKRGYSIPEIVKVIEMVCKQNEKYNFRVQDTETVLNGFDIFYEIQDSSSMLDSEIEEFMKGIVEIFERVDTWMELERRYAVSFEFEIDDNIKIACCQYLHYFIQFLDDLGIQAQSEIADKAGKILFEVIPKDKTIALQNIKECLQVYIELIEDSSLKKYTDYGNVAVMQLRANVMHLQSQLDLAQAQIELKNQIISCKEQLIESMKTSIQDKVKEEKDEVELMSGIVKVKELELNGGSINLPRILELLKRKLK
ncbi:MAG: hypothetical protein ACLSH8_15605 [Zhenhengia sp.]|uniref:hypothetical protein n=1 Tax=Zhenhengia sp. TaxID=2944208 RepID=UPI00290C7741|nr:hypothetical protein [Clostridiales bacterium]MDU6974895.1 hypothetical protein [Clostridiales bacterium]